MRIVGLDEQRAATRADDQQSVAYSASSASEQDGHSLDLPSNHSMNSSVAGGEISENSTSQAGPSNLLQGHSTPTSHHLLHRKSGILRRVRRMSAKETGKVLKVKHSKSAELPKGGASGSVPYGHDGHAGQAPVLEEAAVFASSSSRVPDEDPGARNRGGSINASKRNGVFAGRPRSATVIGLMSTNTFHAPPTITPPAATSPTVVFNLPEPRVKLALRQPVLEEDSSTTLDILRKARRHLEACRPQPLTFDSIMSVEMSADRDMRYEHRPDDHNFVLTNSWPRAPPSELGTTEHGYKLVRTVVRSSLPSLISTKETTHIIALEYTLTRGAKVLQLTWTREYGTLREEDVARIDGEFERLGKGHYFPEELFRKAGFWKTTAEEIQKSAQGWTRARAPR